MLGIQKEPVEAGFGQQLGYRRRIEGQHRAQEQVALLKSLAEMVGHRLILPFLVGLPPTGMRCAAAGCLQYSFIAQPI